ncbi:MAG: tetratricopeptide repeat protein, partial [Bacteroidales bacterium]|nr:tetratricopeptide repeat protein [Bacteroidales bacterium]
MSAQSEINKDSLLNIVNLNTGSTETIEALNQLAKYYFDRNIDTAIIFGKKALVLSQKISYEKGIADSYRNLGRLYTMSGEYKKSFSYFYKALKINEALNDSLSIGKNYSSIGIVHYYQGDIEKALEFCEKTVAIYNTNNYTEGL